MAAVADRSPDTKAARLDTETGTASAPRAPWRGLLVGALLIPVNTLWINWGYMVTTSRPDTVSLFYNVIFTILLLTLLNFALRRWAPVLALTQGELLIVYSMLSIATSICGLDFIAPLITIISHPIWFASDANNWERLFLEHIQPGVIPTDYDSLRNYIQGRSSLWQDEAYRAWLLPFWIWGAFVFVLFLGMLCINTIVRKDWVERSRLSFPIVQLPLEMTRPDGSFFCNRLMWLGAGLAFLFNMQNGLHVLNPVLPAPGGTPYEPQYNLVTYLASPPWNAIGWTPFNLMPFALGLGFLIPLDLSFSLWFFYLFWKGQRVLNSAMGYAAIPDAPFVYEQMLAGFLSFCGITLWMSREHLRRVWHYALWPRRQPTGGTAGKPDADEPMSYRAAVFGLLLSFLFLCGFSIWIGMTPWVAPVFFLIYLAMVTAVTRLRAELGSPVHDLHWSGPNLVLVQVLGTTTFTPRTLTIFTIYQFFNRAFRGCQMPHQLEAFKLGQEMRLPQRYVLRALLLAIVLGFACSYWSLLYMSYTDHGITGFGNETFSRLATWLTTPKPLDTTRVEALVAGALSAAFLTFMRYRFAWWPFHPAGYAVSGNWSMNLFWVSIFLAWFIKLLLFRYQGIHSYRRALPFFLGLILGDFCGGSFWALYGPIKRAVTYNFLP